MVKVEIIYYSGLILQLLQQKEEFSVKELIKATNLSEADFYMAIGWLACERKIMIRKTKNDMLLQSVSVMVD